MYLVGTEITTPGKGERVYCWTNGTRKDVTKEYQQSRQTVQKELQTAVRAELSIERPSYCMADIAGKNRRNNHMNVTVTLLMN